MEVLPQKEIHYSWGKESIYLFSHPPDLKKLEEQNNKIVRIFSTDLNFSSTDHPLICIGNTTVLTKHPHHFLIQAVKGNIQNFTYLKQGNKTIGASFKIDGIQHSTISGIKGSINEVFSSLPTYLKNKNGSIIRSWNFIENIHQNYHKFNEARNIFFQNKKINDYPAATGIEADLGGAKFNLSLDAISGPPEKLQITTLHSDLQMEAYNYGPKFSRGKVIYFKKEGIKKIYISGTSSVNQQGKSVFCNNPEKNAAYVLRCVEHILEKEGSDIGRIVMSLIYCKDKEHYEEFLKIYKTRQCKFPYIPLFVNICRKDLFFEMECIALG